VSMLLAEADLDRRALSSPGTLQYQALNWLAYGDPANLDFDLVPPDELSEQFLMALLYFSTAGENWDNSVGFLLASSVCSWNGAIVCNPTVVESHPMVVEIYFSENSLRGQLPTELGLLSNLQVFFLSENQLSGLIPREFGRLTKLEDFCICKLFSSELDTIIPLGSVLHFISPTVS
jgi:hypothetical protein